MRLSNRGMLEIASHEGMCLRPYYDSVGVITIAVGATVSEIPDLASWDKSQYITMEWAIDLYKTSLTKYEDGVNRALKVNVSQTQFDSLVSICYNIGVGGLSGSTFMRYINQGRSLIEVKNAIMAWTKNKELIKRRSNEANLFTDGVYTGDGNVLYFDTDGAGRITYKDSYSFDIRPYFL